MLAHERARRFDAALILLATAGSIAIWRSVPARQWNIVPHPPPGWQAEHGFAPVPVEERSRKYDIVVVGATGFLGSLSAAALLGVRSEFKGLASATLLATDVKGDRAEPIIALAGRDMAKLGALYGRFAAAGASMNSVDLIHADLDEPSTLDAFVSNTKVVLNFAGRHWDSTTIDTEGYGKHTLSMS